jgi:hypothetical protein
MFAKHSGPAGWQRTSPNNECRAMQTGGVEHQHPKVTPLWQQLVM